ncbi:MULTISPECIES: multidrug efflux SMR transporter [Lactobacillus]|uniref:DMT family transporter n=1 Tax=Lactobacillus TaxID=1578 RepID=UPI000CD8134E|nr:MULTISPECIES: multidrug efflux SMR transporter [Lactobacillus]RVU76995.1 multidrug efflux SMR transporter [Lactobacillus xujianguonis]
MSWIFLVIAGLCEVFWSTMMKLSNGFSNLWFSVLTVIGMIASFAGLIIATKHLPLSIAYPVWTGIGAVGAVVVGIFCFHENLNWQTLIFVAFLIIGIIGIKLTSAE